MRIRLQLLLPILLAALIGAGFLLTGALVESAVRDSLTTVAGITRERAVEAALRAVALAGLLVVLLAVVGGALLARFIVRPLERIRRAAERLDAPGATPPVPPTPVAEIRDVAAGISRAADGFRERHERALREGSELSALVEAVSEGIVQVDRAGRVVRANRAGRRLLRLPDNPEGRPVAALLRSQDLRRIAERGMEGSVTAGEEVVIDDSRVMVSLSPQPAGGFVATLVDLTDLRRLEEVRRDFVANASHELKTPLTSIRGYSETLLGADLPEEDRHQFLATIARNAERLQHIVDDLLDLSRLESGRWEPELTPIHALQAAERAWEPFAERARERGVHFTAGAQGDDRVLADRGALDHIFANLYDNALRYTPAGGRIDVRIRPVTPPRTAGNTGVMGGGEWAAAAGAGAAGAGAGEVEGAGAGAGDGEGAGAGKSPRWIAIEVADTGAGIPRDALPRIFERFYRVDPARSRAEGGTGLGLSIVKHMIETMGGQVEAESLLGKGSTIRLHLPTS